MKLDSELRTLLYLQKILESNSKVGKTLLVLKAVMAALILICIVAFVFASSGKLSVEIAIPLSAICGLLVGYISYYIRSIEIWPHYRPHVSKASVTKRINELET